MILRKVSLLLTLWLGCILAANAQDPSTNAPRLRKIAQDIKEAQEKVYAQALIYAKLKGWPVSFVTKTGAVVQLTGLDPFGNPIYTSTFNNSIAAATTRTNQLWPGGRTGLNLSGSSDAVKGKLAIWDGGSPLTNHVELNGRITVKDGASVDDHATHTAGTLIATGINPAARGMAFGAQQLLSYNYKNDVSEMATEAPNLLLSNHSYGNLAGWNYDGTDWSWYGDTTISRESHYFGWYSSAAQLYDSISYNAPFYLLCFATGNSRNEVGPAVGASYKYNGGASVTRVSINKNPDLGSVALNGTAKNVLLVGAVNGLPNGYQNPSDVELADFSSAGPTDDGRIKPDLVADGVDVTSTSSSSTTAYETQSGSSMATPNVTGSLYLLQEYYNRLHPNQFMRAATLKGIAIHTADEAGPAPGPDYRYGWGLLNVERGANLITGSFKQLSDTIIEKTLDNGANATYTLNVTASGKGRLYATLVWNDPPATVNTNKSTVHNDPTPKLVHDLDLRITSQSNGTVSLPWVLKPSSPSSGATKGDNVLDNVEQVVVDDAIPGQSYTLQVTHKRSLERSTQPFSLLVSGVGGSTYCASAASSSNGTRIDAVNFAGMSNTTPAGCTTYRDFTNLPPAEIEPKTTVPVSVQLNSCDGSSSNRVVKLYIDYNNDGVFNETTELAASGSVAGGTQIFTASVTVPALVVGNTTRLRIVAQETNTAATVSACGIYANGETQDYRVHFAVPTSDLALAAVTLPVSNTCANEAQRVQVTVRNLGKVSQIPVQVVAVVKTGNTTVATLTGTFPPPTAAMPTMTYTLQTPFNSLPATAYTITAYLTNNASDQNVDNDSLTTSLTTAALPPTPAGAAEICDNTALLRVTNPAPGANYFWYASQPPAAPVASGPFASTTTLASPYYLQKGFRGTIGLSTKNGLGSGNYQIGGNYMNYTAQVPLVLESARLFTRGYGTVTLYVADFVSGSGSILTAATIDVYPTNPNYLTDKSSVNNPADTGAIFPIGLSLPAGSHSIYVAASDTLLFRNNALLNNYYPFTLPNVISITGNNADMQSLYYYYLYNMTVATTDCRSDAAAVVPVTAPAPVISQSGNNLVSNQPLGNQWYRNGAVIPGAAGNTYTPTESGTYTTLVTDAFGCQRRSNGITVTLTSTPVSPSAEITLQVSPNPARDKITVKMHLPAPANLQLELLTLLGQKVYTGNARNAMGDFTTTIETAAFPAGLYLLRITDGRQTYEQKVLLSR